MPQRQHQPGDLLLLPWLLRLLLLLLLLECLLHSYPHSVLPLHW